jgi:hypothetical protein
MVIKPYDLIYPLSPRLGVEGGGEGGGGKRLYI